MTMAAANAEIRAADESAKTRKRPLEHSRERALWQLEHWLEEQLLANRPLLPDGFEWPVSLTAQDRRRLNRCHGVGREAIAAIFDLLPQGDGDARSFDACFNCDGPLPRWPGAMFCGMTCCKAFFRKLASRS